MIRSLARRDVCGVNLLFLVGASTVLVGGLAGAVSSGSPAVAYAIGLVVAFGVPSYYHTTIGVGRGRPDHPGGREGGSV